MREAKISEIKNQLSRYLRIVRNGEVVRILDRKTPIAEIVPIAVRRSRGDDERWLAELERRGVVRRGTGKIPREIVAKPPPGRISGAVRTLIEERNER